MIRGRYVREGGGYDAVDDHLRGQLPELATQATLTTEQLL